MKHAVSGGPVVVAGIVEVEGPLEVVVELPPVVVGEIDDVEGPLEVVEPPPIVVVEVDVVFPPLWELSLAESELPRATRTPTPAAAPAAAPATTPAPMPPPVAVAVTAPVAERNPLIPVAWKPAGIAGRPP